MLGHVSPAWGHVLGGEGCVQAARQRERKERKTRAYRQYVRAIVVGSRLSHCMVARIRSALEVHRGSPFTCSQSHGAMSHAFGPPPAPPQPAAR